MNTTMRRIALMLAVLIVASACAGERPSREPDRAAGSGRQPQAAAPGVDAPSGSPATSAAAIRRTARRPAAKARDVVAPAPPAGAGAVVGDTITVVFYWRGDRTRTSPFLRAAGVDANVQEDQAFLAYVDYINKHASFMGRPFDLHGRKLRGVVVDAGDSPELNVAAAERIAKEIKPFAAMAGTGSVSAYACRVLARAGVFNLGTYEVEFDLARRTNGWCIPSAASFDAQVDAVVRYVSGRLAKPSQSRTFGLVFSEYPGLAEAVPEVVDRLKKAGVQVAATASVSASLSTAQQQAPAVVAKMRAAGVNTIVIPDAGTPLSLLPVAEAQAYTPDYVIWPCSGQDVPAMVRLYDVRQWERAEGLTCYDAEFGTDLTLDDEARATQWYAQYRAVAQGEPPAQAPYVYAQFVPLLAGVTGAGRALTPASFLEGLGRHVPYRYSAVRGATTDERSALVAPGTEGSLFADFTVLRWSNGARRRGGAPGAYVFPEDGRRYPRTHAY